MTTLGNFLLLLSLPLKLQDLQLTIGLDQTWRPVVGLESVSCTECGHAPTICALCNVGLKQNTNIFSKSILYIMDTAWLLS